MSIMLCKVSAVRQQATGSPTCSSWPLSKQTADGCGCECEPEPRPCRPVPARAGPCPVTSDVIGSRKRKAQL